MFVNDQKPFEEEKNKKKNNKEFENIKIFQQHEKFDYYQTLKL